MVIEGSRHIGKTVKEKQPSSQVSEMETVFTMVMRCSSAFASATRTASETYDPKTSLPEGLLKC
jgi:hypothetical protein